MNALSVRKFETNSILHTRVGLQLLQGQVKQKETVDQRLQPLTLGQGLSFMARQRQPTSRRMHLTFNSK